ncbi:ribosome biogenesis protein BOP1-like protein isoform X1 [Iris pallida]|uniref:Ribosome biogenesis protein BOP1-like protein isoform X1 n=1 Tax=Iris pallida TaxID=29817 RepID=A0AAX6EQ01_IRIPA|nr:ribosome biogenesis protein BOP1-like protein isoform X1 [Iris pallida]
MSSSRQPTALVIFSSMTEDDNSRSRISGHRRRAILQVSFPSWAEYLATADVPSPTYHFRRQGLASAVRYTIWPV